MSASQWPQVEALLDVALDLGDAARVALLDDPSTGEASVRAEVRRLLGMATDADRFFGASAADLAAPLLASVDADDAAALAAPERVGPYRVVREIARGGMGTVYLAERDDAEFRMRVALKLVSPGMDSTGALRRFREERQILASLEHPHIARLLDGGVAADGRPFFTMEYVDGTPIDRFCAERALSVEARLELFCQVCGAVEFAHRSLVVHRDLKPSNILVAADGTPRLLDFGIARLLAQDDAADPAALTRTGVRLMTPAYASPEQIRGAAVTTASDVYALGVLLYELLSGRHPHRVPGIAPHDLANAILDAEPVAPSEVAREAVRRRLRGDLDTIVLMALRKEPERRYGTADRLAADIRRHLDGQPVAARPATRGYRAGKFLGRHRAGVAAAVLLLLSLVAGLAGTTWQARAATRQAARAEAVKDFLIGLFRAETPGVSRGAELTARQLLDQGAARVAVEMADQPAEQAELLTVLAATYLELGLPDLAEPLVARALEIRRRLHGERHELVAATRHQAAQVSVERGDLAAAEREFRQVLALRRRLHGNIHPGVAATLHNLGGILARRGDHAAAEAMLREVLRIERRLHGDDHLEVAEGLNTLGVLLWRRADYEAAAATHRDALAMRRRHLDDGHPDVLTSLFNLATAREELGDPEAESMYREVLEGRRRIYRGAHPILAVTLENLAGHLSRRGALGEAETYSLEALEIKRQLLGADHPDVGAALNNLAVVKYRTGDLDAAERLMRDALRIWRAGGAETNPYVASALNNLGGILNQRDRPAAALPLLLEALAMRRALLGDAHPEVAQTLRNLGIARHATGDLPAAEAHLREALDVYRAALPEGHLRTAEVLVALGAVLIDRGRAAAAEPLLGEALQTRRGALEAADWRIAEAATLLGHALVVRRAHADAEPLLLESIEILRGSESAPQAALRRRAAAQLARVHAATGRRSLDDARRAPLRQ